MILNHDFCTVERTVETTRNALLLIQTDPWATKLETAGYSTVRIREGFELADSLKNRLRTIQGMFGENVLAVTSQHKNIRTVKAMYECTRRIAELAFSDLLAAQIALHLNHHSENWIADARQFYDALHQNKAYSATLYSWGYSAHRLREESERVKVCSPISPDYPELHLSEEIICDLEILSGWCSNLIDSTRNELEESNQYGEFLQLYS